MAKKRLDKDKIIRAFLLAAADKSPGAVSLADVAERLGVNKASLYNHFESREAIFGETLDFCASYLGSSSFAPAEDDERARLSPVDSLAKTIRRYFRAREMEPLFHAYIFVKSCEFFSTKAAAAAEDERRKVADGVFRMTMAFSRAGKIRPLSEAEARPRCGFLASAISAQLELYMARKKSAIRASPDAGAGSLFSLPTDDALLDEIVEADILYFNSFAK